MQVLVRLLRRHGAVLSRAAVDANKWTEAVLWTTHQHGARCLAIRGVVSRVDQVPMACLFSPTVARVEGDRMVIRGIERVEETEGRVIAVVQEWEVRHRPALGPKGLLDPAAAERRADLPPQAN